MGVERERHDASRLRPARVSCSNLSILLLYDDDEVWRSQDESTNTASPWRTSASPVLGEVSSRTCLSQEARKGRAKHGGCRWMAEGIDWEGGEWDGRKPRKGRKTPYYCWFAPCGPARDNTVGTLLVGKRPYCESNRWPCVRSCEIGRKGGRGSSKKDARTSVQTAVTYLAGVRS